LGHFGLEPELVTLAGIHYQIAFYNQFITTQQGIEIYKFVLLSKQRYGMF
jgi:hypothetical protein